MTLLSSASCGITVALSVSCSPFFNVTSCLFNETDSADLLTTSTVHVSENCSSPEVAVISAVPYACAVTVPFSSTDATDGSDDSQVTDRSDASSGSTSAASVSCSPMCKDKWFLFSVTEVTGTTTMIMQVSLYPLVLEAVMMAMPLLSAVTIPF